MYYHLCKGMGTFLVVQGSTFIISISMWLVVFYVIFPPKVNHILLK